MLPRRQFCIAGAGVVATLAGCRADDDTAHIAGGFTGIQVERGHWMRDSLQSGRAQPSPTRTFKTRVLIAGGGVAGLAAARALRLQGMDDFALLELEDSAGGNSRAGQIGGIACPQGAHYLPLPSDDAPEVQDLLEELGLRTRVAGRWQYDERHLCHSPQERLFFNGEWQDGLLPLNGVGPDTLAQYQKFAALVAQARSATRWPLPVQNGALAPVQSALVAITFDKYLDQNGLSDAHLRWYLNYCCSDEYGAGIATVSAWAGIHYFASRHGFHAPGTEGLEREGLLTWPEGNAWLTQRMAAPLGERLHTGRVVLRITSAKHGVEVDAFNTATQSMERWQAEQVVVALPVFVAARVVQNPPEFLRQAAAQVVYAPWLVANIHLDRPLHDRPGAAPSWDNVLYGEKGGGEVDGAQGGTAGEPHGSTSLGYVDATHQNLQALPGPTVLTHYRALGDVAGGPSAGRKLLLNQPWSTWRNTILAELAIAHPDLAAKATRMDITRYGHAMAIPLPQANGQIGLKPPSNNNNALSIKERNGQGHPQRSVLSWDRLRFAHSDWAGYSVFEEAFTAGHAAV